MASLVSKFTVKFRTFHIEWFHRTVL